MNAAPSDVAGQDAAMLEATSVEPAQPVIRPEEDGEGDKNETFCHVLP